jgi:hypothetical protein
MGISDLTNAWSAAACLARQLCKRGMPLCPSFVKAQGGPAQLACVGVGREDAANWSGMERFPFMPPPGSSS